MGTSAFLVLLLVVLYLDHVDARSKCEEGGRVYERHLRRYNICLSKGFESGLGCEYDASKHVRVRSKCAKYEAELANCGYTCAIDGGWSEFSYWSECSAECGGGSQTRSRACDNPAPENGGAECEGDGTETLDCNVHPCPVHGGWEEWNEWGECDVECGGGLQGRSRSCVNPAPAYGGAYCVGFAGESRPCNTKPCKKQKVKQPKGPKGGKQPKGPKGGKRPKRPRGR